MDWRNDRIGSAQRGENPTVLSELASGYAVIGDPQFLPGYCLLLSKDPTAKALSDFHRTDRIQFLSDMDLLATAVEQACSATDAGFRRVNLEILGNMDSYVHAHIFPRYEWEPADMRFRPVWHYDPHRWGDPATLLSAKHSALRQCISDELQKLRGTKPQAEPAPHDLL